MKFDVLNRFSGKVQFTADIDCDESASRSVKLGLAVKWANLRWANLRGADLSGANLRGADLSGANLRGADLRWANLRWANLRGADLRWANLRGANLSRADLRGADLSGADLSGANLSRADLSGADLSGANGNNKEITTIQTGKYIITMFGDVMAIGCQQHTVDEWMAFDASTISEMDHGALEWWRVWKPIIASIIEVKK